MKNMLYLLLMIAFFASQIQAQISLHGYETYVVDDPDYRYDTDYTSDYSILTYLNCLSVCTKSKGHSVINIDGGNIFDSAIYDNASVNLTNGSLKSFSVSDNGIVNITGGVLQKDYNWNTMRDDSQVFISGGNISGTFEMMYGSPEMTLSGSSFYIGDVLLEYGQLDFDYLADIGAITRTERTGYFKWITYTGNITGILDDGNSIDITFMAYDHISPAYGEASIVLVPEPISLCLLGLGGIITIKKRVNKNPGYRNIVRNIQTG